MWVFSQLIRGYKQTFTVKVSRWENPKYSQFRSISIAQNLEDTLCYNVIKPEKLNTSKPKQSKTNLSLQVLLYIRRHYTVPPLDYCITMVSTTSEPQSPLKSVYL